DRQRLGPVTFTFTGTHAENTTPVETPDGIYNIDARARWGSGKDQAGWDISSAQTCGTTDVVPKFEIQKLQAIKNSGSGFVETPLAGQVGQTIDYEIIVSNLGTGNVKFSGFGDPKCDPGTITG